MNLEKVLSELKVLRSGAPITYQAMQPVAAAAAVPITAGQGLAPPGLSTPGGLSAPGGAAAPAAEEEWVDPHEAQKKKKEKDDEQHLLKPIIPWIPRRGNATSLGCNPSREMAAVSDSEG